jgi:hypothetical protein
MKRPTAIAVLLGSLLLPMPTVFAAGLSAAQIVDRNVAARGGLTAWRAVKTLSMSGKMDAGKVRPPDDNPYTHSRMDTRVIKAEIRQAVLERDKQAEAGKPEDKVMQLPFVLEMKRPYKTRLELQFEGKTAVQTFDGKAGWKLRPFLNRTDVDPFTADEMKTAAQQQELDGPLIDYAAKGTQIALDGTEKVDGRDAYKLKLTLKSGQVRYVWVDTKTFLDVKVDGSRRLDGKPHPVATFLRDYRPVDGLMIPHLIETSVEGVKDSERIIVDKVAVNPSLADALFGKPQ